MRDVQRQLRYWGRVPPPHELIAAYLGIDDLGPSGSGYKVTDEDRQMLEQLNANTFGLVRANA